MFYPAVALALKPRSEPHRRLTATEVALSKERVCLTVVYRPAGRTCNGDLSEAPLSVAAGGYGTVRGSSQGHAGPPGRFQERREDCEVHCRQGPCFGFGACRILVCRRR